MSSGILGLPVGTGLLVSLLNLCFKPSTPQGVCLLLNTSCTSFHASMSIGRICSMVFNRVVVSAFVKPLPHLIDVGGCRLGMVKVVGKMQKNWLNKGFCITFVFHEIKWFLPLSFHEMQM